MSVSWRYARYQVPVLGGLIRLALSGLAAPLRTGRGIDGPSEPASAFRWRRAPVNRDLLRAYLRHVGGAEDGDALPPHLFPYWCFPVAGRLGGRLPWAMSRAVNAGCSVQVRRPLPRNEALEVQGWIAQTEQSERKLLVTMRFVTSTRSAPDALETDLVLLVPRGGGKKRSSQAEPIPGSAREMASCVLGASAGLDFAKLTGDFNPLHWSSAYARRLGFASVILQGLATAARAWVALETGEGRTLHAFECRFSRPVPLPSTMRIYAEGERFWVGLSASDAPRLIGRFRSSPEIPDAPRASLQGSGFSA